MTKEELLLEAKKLSDEDRESLIWSLLGTNLRPWTEAQQLSYLLDVITCPEGHAGDFNRFRIEGMVEKVIESDGTMVPSREREESSFELYPVIDGLECLECLRLKMPPDFAIPNYVSNLLFLVEE